MRDTGDSSRYPGWIASVGLMLVVGLNLFLAAAPTFTNDFWFHLKMGEIYWNEGLWPDADPMLHTARPDAPIQHEWLFGVAVYGVERMFGFYGIRAIHLLSVLGTLWLAYSILRKRASSQVMACFATASFAVLAWNRLFQVRPDLLSIPAAMLTYRLILESRQAPSAARVLGFAGMIWLWANAHSLFALGPILLFAAILGLGLLALLEWWSGGPVGNTATRKTALWVALAMGAGIAISLLNPRGIEQHLTFFSSSRDAAIWAVKDEWSHFNPIDPSSNLGTVSTLLWSLTNVVFAGFAATSLLAGWRCRRRTREVLQVFDPVLFGLGLASLVAILVSIRFLWMSIFPMLFVLDFASRNPVGRVGRLTSSWILALATLGLAGQFYWASGYRNILSRVPSSPGAYLETPYMSRKFHVEGVRFLRASGVEGNLFNSYGMGGFLGYWLSPRLRTFIDSRTEHYPAVVASDYARINTMRDMGQGQTFLDLLDRASVDLFFGIGLPVGAGRGGAQPYTAANLENAPGWILVSRSFHHAIYLRDVPRNALNLRRVSSYYAAQGIPFDRKLGIDVAAVLDRDIAWAVAHELLTQGQANRIAARDSRDEGLAAAALDTLAQVYTLAGNYRAAARIDRAIPLPRPNPKSSLIRQIYLDIKLDHPEQAMEKSWTLQRLDLDDPHSAAIHGVVTAYRHLSQKTQGRLDSVPRRIALDRVIRQFPLLSTWEAWLLEAGLPGQPPVD